MIRRTFVREAALAAMAAGGLTGSLGALSGLAQPRALGSGSRRLRVNGQTRPFNMVCLGDSVMWGQGLKDSSKFTALVESWLQSKLPGRPVNRYVFARSGATITTDAEFDESKIEPWMNDPTLGEVPCSWPYVERQVVVARDYLASHQISADAVDLVLLDGGINDMRVTTVLKEFNTAELVRQKSNQYCNVQMTRLLTQVRNVFQNAKIVVTGYFPIVSEKSDLGFIAALISFPVPAPIAAVLTVDARSRLAALSTAWYNASNADLAAAVASFNAQWGWSKSRAMFARIPWGAEHCYAAPSSRLWLLGLPEDEVYTERHFACDRAGNGKVADITCLEAKMGHPNPAGARAYAEACKTQLNRYLPEWLGLKQMAACVEMDPMPRTGVQTSLTVYATADGPTGRMRVPGTVRIGSQTYPTDTPVPVTLCAARRTTTIDQSGTRPMREVGEKVVSCSPITVSAAGYVDVVVRDYLNAYALP
jgi:lysophospholipase L1-like esterase